MTIIEDTGQKQGQHDNIKKFCEENGIILRRQKLNVGDYQIAPKVSVDTKKGMEEIYSDVVQDHDRFRKECIRAMEDGTRLVILIENQDGMTCLEDVACWKNPRYEKWKRDNSFVLNAQAAGKMLNVKVPTPPVSAERLMNMMKAMSMKYSVEWLFCHPNETGKAVMEILTESR